MFILAPVRTHAYSRTPLALTRTTEVYTLAKPVILAAHINGLFINVTYPTRYSCPVRPLRVECYQFLMITRVHHFNIIG